MGAEEWEAKLDRLVGLMQREEAALAIVLSGRRVKGREAARKVADSLRSRWPSVNLWLCGSQACDHARLSAISDLDILARGIPPAEHVEAQVTAEEVALGFPVDLVLYEDLAEAARSMMFREAIEL